MRNTINISLQPLNKNISVVSGSSLIDVLHEYGVEFPCGGKGTCGTCKVKLLEGCIDIDKNHSQKLKALKLGSDFRLACFSTVKSDITLEISQFDDIILADNTRFDFIPKKGYGIAVDLGTTTIVVQLIDLKTGHIVDSISDVNPQVRFGGDLISRVQACLERGSEELQDLVRKRIGEMIGQTLNANPVTVSKVVLVGNTVMHHIFSGIKVDALSFYPFESPDLKKQYFNSEDLGWNLPVNTSIEFFPSIGSFVGSDILAGIAATKMLEKETLSILIDLGTNGEIVLGNRDRIVCASTAAGPAFEGAKINQGMRATTGAISSVKLDNDKLHCHVIGSVEAKGICGSGLIDTMAILLQQEKIGMFGEINSGEEYIQLTPNVNLTQQDIREFQLAKAAIATGIAILLKNYGIAMDEVSDVFIAGGFGNFLTIKNVLRTGLIDCPEEKITKLGNSALIGAKMFLFEDEAFVQRILNQTSHSNLEGDPDFQDIYIEKMMLV